MRRGLSDAATCKHRVSPEPILDLLGRAIGTATDASSVPPPMIVRTCSRLPTLFFRSLLVGLRTVKPVSLEHSPRTQVATYLRACTQRSHSRAQSACRWRIRACESCPSPPLALPCRSADWPRNRISSSPCRGELDHAGRRLREARPKSRLAWSSSIENP